MSHTFLVKRKWSMADFPVQQNHDEAAEAAAAVKIICNPNWNVMKISAFNMWFNGSS